MRKRHPCVRASLVIVLTVFGLLCPAGPTNSQGVVPESPSAASSSRGATSNESLLHFFLPLLTKAWPPRPSSFDKIAEALAAGQIDPETALLYRVYATFSDPLLPEAYRGDDTGEGMEGEVAVREMVGRWSDLQVPTQRALSPFIQPPSYIGSWYDRRHFPQPQSTLQGDLGPQDEPAPPEFRVPGWKWIDTPDGKIRVWWVDTERPQDAALAATVASLMSDHAWPDLTNVLGNGGNPRLPISDEGVHEWTDKYGYDHVWADGGNGRLDIYLTECTKCGGALTVAYPPGCTARPAFFNIDRTATRQKVEAATAHEFMHVLQYSYRYAHDDRECYEYLWSDEATADWAIDFVYPDNQLEHTHEDRFLRPDQLPRHSSYDEWPFFVYLTHTVNTDIVKTALGKMESDFSFPAINAALSPGGFRQYWPEYALNLWNRPPVDFFKQRDGFAKGAYGYGLLEVEDPWLGDPQDYTIEVKLAGQRGVQYILPINLPALSMRYFHFTFPDPSARSVEFSNLYVSNFPDPDVRVQALVKVKGQDWVVRDWSEAWQKAYCRDVAAERLEELVLIFSNAQWQDEGQVLTPPVRPKLTVTNVGCYQWRGTATATHQRKSAPRTETSSGTLLFERRASPDNESASKDYDLKQGQVHVEQTGADAQGCVLHMPPLDQTLDPEDGDLVVASMSVSDPQGVGRFSGIAGAHGYRELTYICENGSYTNLETSLPTFRTDAFRPLYVSADGMSIDVTQVIDRESEGWVSTHTFHFVAVTQP